MASQGVNVLRWSAFAGGIVYAIYHQASIRSQDRVHQRQAQIKHQQSLIDKARKDWANKTQPLNSNGVISDPDDPKFDLEAWLNSKAEAKS